MSKYPDRVITVLPVFSLSNTSDGAINMAQFYGGPRIIDCGERRLMFAVLDQAITDLQCRKAALRAQFNRREAARWVMAKDTHLFSFNSICEALGFDPDYIRAGLRRLMPEFKD